MRKLLPTNANLRCSATISCNLLQDYKEAARLRDSLRLFEEEEPVLRLRRSLKKAVEEERFAVLHSSIAIVPAANFATSSF